MLPVYYPPCTSLPSASFYGKENPWWPTADVFFPHLWVGLEVSHLSCFPSQQCWLLSLSIEVVAFPTNYHHLVFLITFLFWNHFRIIEELQGHHGVPPSPVVSGLWLLCAIILFVQSSLTQCKKYRSRGPLDLRRSLRCTGWREPSVLGWGELYLRDEGPNSVGRRGSLQIT